MAKRKTLDDLRYEATMRAVANSRRKKGAAELKGETAALAGIGVSDSEELQRAVTEQCGPFALSERSDWLLGHENAVYVMDEMAAEMATAAFVRVLGSIGIEVTARGSTLDIAGPGIGLRVKVEAAIAPKFADLIEEMK